jgi:hypothetical protein
MSATYHRRHIGPRVPQLGVGIEDNLCQIGQHVSGPESARVSRLVEASLGGYLRDTVDPDALWRPFNSE